MIRQKAYNLVGVNWGEFSRACPFRFFVMRFLLLFLLSGHKVGHWLLKAFENNVKVFCCCGFLTCSVVFWAPFWSLVVLLSLAGH